MFTNNNIPILGREEKILQSVQLFTKQVEVPECSSVLDDLFFEWIGSESCDSTDSEYRSKVVYNYRILKSLLTCINSNLNQKT